MTHTDTVYTCADCPWTHTVTLCGYRYFRQRIDVDVMLSHMHCPPQAMQRGPYHTGEGERRNKRLNKQDKLIASGEKLRLSQSFVNFQTYLYTHCQDIQLPSNFRRNC